MTSRHRRGSFQKPPLGVQRDSSHRLAQGLVGCWLFNEGAGSRLIDLSPYGNHGTLTNFAYTPASGWGGGRRGPALSFDGSNDYVDVGSGTSYDVPTLTVSAWIKRNATGVAHAIVADNINSSSDKDHFFDWFVNASNVLYLSFGDGTTHGSVTSTKSITDTNWHHVTVYRNDATEKVQFFVDGMADGEKNYANTLGTLITLGTNNLWIGKRNVTSFPLPFNGLIDDVRIYNRVLLAGESAELARAEYAEFQWPRTVRYFVPAAAVTRVHAMGGFWGALVRGMW